MQRPRATENLAARRSGSRPQARSRLQRHQEATVPRHRGPGPGHRGAADRPVQPRPLHPRRRARPGQDLDDQHAGQDAVAGLQPHPVHARPDAVGHHRHRGDRGEPHAPATASSSSSKARCSPTSSWPTKSTARRPRRRPPCSKPCRSARSPWAACGTSSADPFFVLATQNPIEQEGTYPLPEAQQDRFMFKVFVKYPELQGGVRDRPAHDDAATRGDHAGAVRRADPGAAAAGAARAGDRSRHPVHAGAGAADARRASRACRSSSRTGCPGAPARVPCRT